LVSHQLAFGAMREFFGAIYQGEFIIRELILALMSARRHGLARRGKA
jgi:hypothetical protein